MVDKCPECGNRHLTRDYEKGEVVCTNCGLIVAENLEDPRPEWRAFDAEQRDKRARGGAPIKYMRPNNGQSVLKFGVGNGLIPIRIAGLNSVGCKRVCLPNIGRQLNAGLFQ